MHRSRAACGRPCGCHLSATESRRPRRAAGRTQEAFYRLAYTMYYSTGTMNTLYGSRLLRVVQYSDTPVHRRVLIVAVSAKLPNQSK